MRPGMTIHRLQSLIIVTDKGGRRDVPDKNRKTRKRNSEQQQWRSKTITCERQETDPVVRTFKFQRAYTEKNVMTDDIQVHHHS